MISTEFLGTAEPMAACILFRVVRVGSGTLARYWSTVFGAGRVFFLGLRVLHFRFFMLEVLRGII
jgi:hypothetical protein